MLLHTIPTPTPIPLPNKGVCIFGPVCLYGCLFVGVSSLSFFTVHVHNSWSIILKFCTSNKRNMEKVISIKENKGCRPGESNIPLTFPK